MLVESWQEALPLLVREMKTFDTVTAKAPLSEGQIAGLLPITDVLRTILFNKSGSIHAFRDIGSHSAIRPLVWAARGEDRPLRINSTYVLASVVDNRTVCVVLHHLRDPSISPDGRVNLLQVAMSMAGYAYADIVEETMETLEIIRSTQTDIGSQSARLMEDLDRRTRGSSNRNDRSPFPECSGYDYSAPLDPPVEVLETTSEEVVNPE
jgi:hypothetical protein